MADSGKIDPMHQFEVQNLWNGFAIGGHQIAFTNSALWMCVAVVALWLFMLGGMKQETVPGRWQMTVEAFTNFITDLVDSNIGAGGRAYRPYIFSLFMFILFANVAGMLPLGLIGIQPFPVTSHFTITGILALLSFSIVLIVGFWKHGLRFFTLFIPHGTPLAIGLVLFPIELVSFLFRPFSLGLRLFVAVTAGHVLLEVLASFVVSSTNAGPLYGISIAIPSFALMVAICVLELLVAAIQAYIFAILTSIYINDAEHLH